MKRRHKLPAFSVLQLSLSNVNHSNPPTKLESGGEPNEISSHGTVVVLTLKCVNVSCWQIFRECVKSWLRLSAADHFPQLKIWCWKPMELIENFFGVIRGIGSWAGSSTSSSIASLPLSPTLGLRSTLLGVFQQTATGGQFNWLLQRARLWHYPSLFSVQTLSLQCITIKKSSTARRRSD